jgi:SNF2 family DNA or RNA helicase
MASASNELSEIAEASACYRGLGQIHRQLVPIRLRRTRKEVLKDLPPRTEHMFYVPLTEKKAEP